MPFDTPTLILAPTCILFLGIAVAEGLSLVKAKRQARDLESEMIRTKEEARREIDQYKETLTSLRRRHEEESEQKDATIHELREKLNSSGVKLPPYIPMHERKK